MIYSGLEVDASFPPFIPARLYQLGLDRVDQLLDLVSNVTPSFIFILLHVKLHSMEKPDTMLSIWLTSEDTDSNAL